MEVTLGLMKRDIYNLGRPSNSILAELVPLIVMLAKRIEQLEETVGKLEAGHGRDH